VLTYRVVTVRAAGSMPRETTLVTFFPHPAGLAAEAAHFDDLGRAAHGEAVWSGDRRRLVVAAQPEHGEPRWRLTWTFEDPDTLATCLESAPSAAAPFEMIVRGTLRRAGVPAR
jgi:hypothetical protein